MSLRGLELELECEFAIQESNMAAILEIQDGCHLKLILDIING